MGNLTRMRHEQIIKAKDEEDNFKKQYNEKYAAADPYNKAKMANKLSKKKAATKRLVDLDNKREGGATSGQSSSNAENAESGSGESSGAETASKVLAGGEALGSALGIGQDKTSTGDQVASGVMKYASLGGQLGGPAGMAAGAVIGGVLGAVKAREARKAAQYEAEADKQEAMIKIEGEKGDRIQRAMAGLGQAFSKNLSRRLQVRL